MTVLSSSAKVMLFQTRSRKTYAFGGPLVMDVLHHFRRPRSTTPPAQLSSEERTRWRGMVAQLLRARILVRDPASSEPGVAPEPLLEDAALVAVAAHEIGSQLPALIGPEHAETLKQLSAQLFAARQLLDAVNSKLVQIGCERVRDNRKRAQRLLRGGPLKVNLASGDRPLEGWINVDIAGADLVQDIRWGLPFPDESVDFLFFAHALEHFYFDRQALAVLREIRRILKPNGVARIVVPDIGKFIRAYVDGDEEFFRVRRAIWPSESECRSPLEQTLWHSGASAAPHAFHCHKWGYDFETLHLLLAEAEFSRIKRCTFMGSEHAELELDDTSEAGAVRVNDRAYSLFVEAQA